MAPSSNGVISVVPESDVEAKILAGYAELQRRDSNAERHRDRWHSIARWLAFGLLVMVGVNVWQSVRHENVQAFVQVVVRDDEGNYILSGVPQKLLEYTPQDGQWMEMLAQWVRSIRWRSENPEFTRTEWAWAYRHSCPEARQHLDFDEKREHPFVKNSSKRVSVGIKSVTKTPTPESYQVLWEEVTTDKVRPGRDVALWTGTFTVGRFHPKTMGDMIDNRLGLCVTAYNLSKQPEK
jgi:type IV secretory pathway TrbF-like protein